MWLWFEKRERCKSASLWVTTSAGRFDVRLLRLASGTVISVVKAPEKALMVKPAKQSKILVLGSLARNTLLVPSQKEKEF